MRLVSLGLQRTFILTVDQLRARGVEDVPRGIVDLRPASLTTGCQRASRHRPSCRCCAGRAVCRAAAASATEFVEPCARQGAYRVAMVRGRGPSPNDFDEQLDRLSELASIEGRLGSLEVVGSERSRLGRRRDQILRAMRRWDVRFLWPGRMNGNGAAS